jgi:exonuclease SbcC
MRLRSLALRGVTRFTSVEPVSIDFDALGSGLIALVGPNGAGKTTVLESVIAALYRSFPSRPGWYEHMHGRDSFLEVLFEEGGSEIRVRTQVDTERRTTEQFVFVDGASVTTGRAAEAAGEVERRFGSLDLLLASVVSAQNKAGNFLLMARSARKELFAELLGLGRLQVLHEAARDRRTGAQVELERARGALAQIDAQLAGKADAEAAVEQARLHQEDIAGRLATAREEEAAATSALERAKTSGERLAALLSARDSAARALAGADQALKDAIASGTKARQEAARRRETNEALARDVEAQEKRANERHTAGAKAIDARRARLEATLAERPELEAAAARIKDLDAERITLEDADIVQVAAERKRDLAEGALVAADLRVEDAEGRLVDEQARLAEEAKLLGRVPCTAEAGWKGRAYETIDLAGTCPLLKAAQDAKARGPQLKVDPALVEAARSAQAAFDTAVEVANSATLACDPIRMTEIQHELTAQRAKAARAAALEQAAADLKGLAGDLKRVNEERSHELKAAAGRRERLAAEASAIEEDLKKALGEAIGRETTARVRVDEARERSLKAEREYQAVASDGQTVPQAEAGLSVARERRYGTERELRDADKAHATTTATLDALAKHEAVLPGAQAEVRDAEEQVGAWLLLEQALGKDGIQALEIDAAGPEVARLCNELLEACYGPRFSISFETLREKKSKAGEFSEAFEVRVRDRGQERPVEALSGGEKVIVGEAIGLAIAILNARKNSIRWETLIRDETSGALDPENAQAYVEMLRRALSLGGFRNVLFVAHQTEVVERADVRLVVADGRVRIHTDAELSTLLPGGVRGEAVA